MNIRELEQLIHNVIPNHTAESWDNVGLLIGDTSTEVTGILTTLDCTVEVIDEAIELGINTIICHHPLIFSGIKQINAGGYGDVIRHAIKHDIQLIAMHTNLDNYKYGVSYMIGKQIGLKAQTILLRASSKLCKLQLFVPNDYTSQLKDALSQVGVGQIGEYAHCFYTSEGTGEFMPSSSANPFVGKNGEIHYEKEMKVECVFEPHLKQQVENVITNVHPYETPAYDIFEYDVTAEYGTGTIGIVDRMTVRTFAQRLKETLNIPSVKVIGDLNAEVSSVSIIGGAGVSYMDQIAGRADVFLTGDIKYHEAHDLLMKGQIAIDIGHYSEYVMIDGLKAIIQNMLPEIKVIASSTNTNPFKEV
ncbi:Nif3-like dinuclear metal center hexameric protein [Macrococcus armenti]|uniref:Nif3-like dinuclear metal center hexameric protein n=1 Tax=Macrococcus armenti TaxID=2875764 RepID=UPI001CCBF37C|nr:Nif3-like dinuclear metal center hexameric protein [Macrococcus armenti]UBH07712.1 Nif3-like dinuclear metal center hexameric protein [Macrococcus armenti]UBH09947.1 Nif3-like dinuclear metal center hexameric protein [Macrococcus armenti]UBH14496.1 Nif3-like dinuclear metal center hexameric protein [Macrococcus armenti]UBH16856.1 Nif3-like dinuclear metal center hexameric protein [Macrococcus armenti]UBH19119.1 Nif3-like dinuclear metal center hexameric protein [Macrococcus armenti]